MAALVAPIADLAGDWVSDVITNPYEKTNTYRLHFSFKVVGDRVLGSVVEKSTPGDSRPYAVSRGILDGRLDGDIVTFRIPYEVLTTDGSGDWITEDHSKALTGVLAGGGLAFIMQDDQGDPPQEFTATRAPAEK